MKQRGEALIESVLALGIAAVIVTGIVVALVVALNNSTFTKNQSQATSFAQEGLDVARNMKDQDYESFSDLTSNKYYCVAEGGTDLDQISCGTKINDTFTRKVYINHNGLASDGITRRCQASPVSTFVASIVSWSDSKCGNTGGDCHKVELDSCLSDLNKVQGP